MVQKFVNDTNIMYLLKVFKVHIRKLVLGMGISSIYFEKYEWNLQKFQKLIEDEQEFL